MERGQVYRLKTQSRDPGSVVGFKPGSTEMKDRQSNHKVIDKPAHACQCHVYSYNLTAKYADSNGHSSWFDGLFFAFHLCEPRFKSHIGLPPQYRVFSPYLKVWVFPMHQHPIQQIEKMLQHKKQAGLFKTFCFNFVNKLCVKLPEDINWYSLVLSHWYPQPS